MSREEALSELQEGAGGQFDPDVVAAFVQLLEGGEGEGEQELRNAA
jgi:HD-GYP domain-containing protein (c-di-GMP phosphodiesterase class II)